MSWPSVTVPPAVSALRDMLVASTTFIAAGGIESSVDYPIADFSESMPRALIIQESERRQVYSAGAGALPTGTLTIEFYDVAKESAIETTAFAIARDIAANQTGLLIRNVSCGMAMEPSVGENAAEVDGESKGIYGVQITVEHGPEI
jgi:hypothetical protein